MHRNPLGVLAAALIILAGCMQAGTSDGLPTIPGPGGVRDREVGERAQFLLIGDQGTQMQDQYDVAKAMKQVCDEKGCDFVIALGDNLYTIGPLLGVNDPQFDLGFESPYAEFDIPFYLTLGNHDNGGSGHIVVHGDYEVAYTYKQGTSGKWQLPSRYYNQTFNDGWLEIWSVDGDTLTAGDSAGGVRLGPDILYDRQPQIDWLAESITNSDARWKIAFGHYQYKTPGYKGDADPLFLDAIEQVVCNKAQFYFFGHQHQLRWSHPVPGCVRTEHINSGSAARATHEPGVGSSVAIEEFFTYEEGPGFWWIEIAGDTFTGTAYGTDATDSTEPVELFQRTVTREALGWA